MSQLGFCTVSHGAVYRRRRLGKSSAVAATQPPAVASAKAGRPATLADRVAALPPMRGATMVELISPMVCAGGCSNCVVVNRDGKRASFRIFEAVVRMHGGVLGRAAAKEALQVYGDVCFEAIGCRGRHPSIDWLFDVAASGRTYVAKVDGHYLH
jgi:hypothetical protein